MIPAPTAPALLRESHQSPADDARASVGEEAFSLPLLDRRTFFKGSVLGVGALWLGSLSRPAHAASIPAAGYTALTDDEVRIVTAIGDALFPATDALPLSAADVHIAREVDAYVATSDPTTAKMIRILFRIIEYGPIIFFESASRFTNLSREDATRHMEGWKDSGIYFRRAAMASIKLMMSMGYFAHPDVRRHIGWVDVCPEGMTDRDPYG